VDYQRAIQEKERHQPRRQSWWQRLRRRPARCRVCNEEWPCTRHQRAKARIIQLLREELQGNAGSHW
jgi:hypothetical protein